MQHNRRSAFIGGIMTIGFIAATLVTVELAQAQTTSNGPYYATPSWDQTLPAATRWIILSNFNSEAVLDRNTGLVWERSPQTAANTWSTARFNCANRTVGNQKGWRLPSFAELSSLMDPSVAPPGPTLPPGHPFGTNIRSASYWSASSNAVNPTNAWVADFFLGASVDDNPKSLTRFVWCVRGPMNADQY